MHSPYFTNLRHHLHEALSKARDEICVAVAWFTDSATASLLMQKAKNGVRIHILIVDDENNQRLHFGELEDLGVELLRIPKEEGLLHFKFCIIDEKIVVYGSANWTYSAFTHNQEQITVVEDDTAFIERFREEFSTLRKRFAKEPSESSEVQQHPERLVLQQEIRLLEAVLAETETEIAEVSSLLNRFESFYQRYLGNILREVLRLRAAIANAQADLTQKHEDQQTAKQYREEYESFTQKEEAKSQEPINGGLDESEYSKPKNKDELHRLFREAVKLCHPDKVEEQFHKAAQDVFVKLKSAFDLGDTETVTRILEELRSGIAWQVPPEQITDIEALRKLRDKYKKHLQEKQGQLQQLLRRPSYIEINAAESWETLIEQERDKLEYERDCLQEELRDLNRR